MKNIWYSKLWWTVIIIGSMTLCIIASQFFYRTFPILEITITMDRKKALIAAQELTKKFNTGPATYQQAISFQEDTCGKTFIELEGGGKGALRTLMHEHVYEPYLWAVRHFNEFDAHEVTIQFTPQGQPYGFLEKIPEHIAGAQLNTTEAQSIAETTAQKNWYIDFSTYTLVESSKKTQPSNRIDHSFVYERPEKIGDGSNRLRLTVSGNQLTEVTHFIKIPEAFSNRYQEMRSANISIAFGANIIMILLYIFGGCIIGTFFLLRTQQLLTKMPFLCALILASISTLAQLNALPLVWMQYNTTLSYTTFLLQFYLSLIGTFFAKLGSALFIIAAAEGLTRVAFGHHIQLWKLWSDNNKSSYTVLGRTVGGYLVSMLHFAFVILFYFITTRTWHWWTPSSALIQPNILATYIPWLGPLSISLNAGFIEECIFRAVPLAGAVLCARFFGHKTKYWVIAASILQAIVFGAAHANYPTFPAYARLIELLIPSTIFGIVYLRFGLLPSIIAHVMYDIIWTALPIFLTTTLSGYLNQIMIIICSSIPLLIILYARSKKTSWQHIPATDYNHAWKPPIQSKKSEPHTISKIETKNIPLNKAIYKITLGTTFIGLMLWFSFTPLKQDAPQLTISRTQAIEYAYQALEAHDIILDKTWTPLPMVFNHYRDNILSQNQHRFIWQKGGRDIYQQLLDTYLAAPQWIIRFARFEGSIIERSQMYWVFVNHNGIAYRISHIIPETIPGKQLTEHDARTIAHETLTKKFLLNPSQLQEIAAESTKLPERIDWKFTFANPQIYPLQDGQARIDIFLAGDIVKETVQYIHVPEEWKRTEEQKNTIYSIFTLLYFLLTSLILFTAAGVSLIQWSNGINIARSFVTIWVSFGILNLCDILNSWPVHIALFNTNEPFFHQVFRLLSIQIIFGILLPSALYALTLLFINKTKSSNHFGQFYSAIIGLGIGSLCVGIFSALKSNFPSIEPLWAIYAPLGTYWPMLGILITNTTAYLITTIFTLLTYIIIEQVTRYSAKWGKFFAFIVCICFGLIYSIKCISSMYLSLWLISGVILGITLFASYWHIARFDRTFIPISTATFLAFFWLQQAFFNAYTGASFGNLASILIAGIIAYYWSRKLSS